MKTLVSGAAAAAVLWSTAACWSAEFPYSPPSPAAEAFAGPVPTIADLPLGMAYDVAKDRFAALGEGFSISTASRDLQLGNASDGTVAYGFPESLHAESKSGAGAFEDERTAVFSSPLSGSQLLMIERRISRGDGEELSIPAFQEAIVGALGEPTAKGGGPNADVPKFVYAWIDGKLVAPTEIPNSETTPSGWIQRRMRKGDATNPLEKRIAACSDLSGFVLNDALIDTVNALSAGKSVPEHCTAMATVLFYTGSQTDLSRSIVVKVAYTGAIVEDAKKVRSFMSDALRSGAGRKKGISIGKF